MRALALLQVKQGGVIGQRLHEPSVAVRGRRDAVPPPLVRHLVGLQDVLEEQFHLGSGGAAGGLAGS